MGYWAWVSTGYGSGYWTWITNPYPCSPTVFYPSFPYWYQGYSNQSISDPDVERIANKVVEKLKEEKR